MKKCKVAFVFGLLAAMTCVLLAPSAVGQIQSTISCPAGNGYWDILSVMMMDPGLASGYHMEGYGSNGDPDAYIYTTWDSSDTKVYYVKNPQGNPWDINLYDSQPSIPQQGYIYQWVTELDEYNGTNYWNDPTSCRKFNNGSDSSTADYSMRWAARCAAPGGTNSSIWNNKTVTPYNTNYYTYVDKVIQSPSQNLDWANLQLLPTSTMTITDTRGPQTFSITTLPLQYTYTCSVNGNLNSCQSQEVFQYGLDTTVNPVDGVKHSYGWVSWALYSNATGGDPNQTASWGSPTQTTINNYLVAGQVPINFQCF
jgi:hypothetical protein